MYSRRWLRYNDRIYDRVLRQISRIQNISINGIGVYKDDSLDASSLVYVYTVIKNLDNYNRCE